MTHSQVDSERTVHWGVLLAVLVAAFLVEPMFGSLRSASITGLALFEIAVVGTIITSVRRPYLRALGYLISGLWFMAAVLSQWVAPLHGLVAGFTTVLVLGALAATFANLLRRSSSDLDTLLGACFGYLLLAMAWAVLFAQIENWQPGSFLSPVSGDAEPNLLYFSMVTMTTLGYGDILPVSSLAQIAAGFEAIVGVLYIAVMVGSIVGGYRGRFTR